MTYYEMWQAVAGELFWLKVTAIGVVAFLLTHEYVGPDDPDGFA